jgi:hypothetical protein
MLVGTLGSSKELLIEYLRTLPSIRERCGRVHDLAKQGKLQYFDYHPEKEQDVTDYCIRIMRVGSTLSSVVPFFFPLLTSRRVA